MPLCAARALLAVLCRYVRLEPLEWFRDFAMRAGVAAHAPTPLQTFKHFTADWNNATEVVKELDVVLTGSRLGKHSRATMEQAYTETLESTGFASKALRHAQKLALIAPEFQLTGAAPDYPKPTKLKQRAEASVSDEQLPYKAIVYVYFSGGADSFNMLIPYDGCDTDRFGEYAAARAEIALPKSSLLPVTTSRTVSERNRKNSQPCRRYGMHSKTKALHRLYNDGDALWVANAGPLVQPLTRDEYKAKIKPQPAGIFSHNIQSRFAKNLDASSKNRATGPVGRMMDELASAGTSTGTYSIAGTSGATILAPQSSKSFDVLSSSRVGTIDAKHKSMVPEVDALLTQVSSFLCRRCAWRQLVVPRPGVRRVWVFAVGTRFIGVAF